MYKQLTINSTEPGAWHDARPAPTESTDATIESMKHNMCYLAFTLLGLAAARAARSSDNVPLRASCFGNDLYAASVLTCTKQVLATRCNEERYLLIDATCTARKFRYEPAAMPLLAREQTVLPST